MNNEELSLYQLTDPDGNVFEGLEVLRMVIDDDGKKRQIIVLQDDKNDRYLFEMLDDDTLDVVEDPNIIETAKEVISMFEQEGKEDNED